MMNVQALADQIKKRQDDNATRAMVAFRALAIEMDCLSDAELELFQNRLLDYSQGMLPGPRKGLLAMVHDASINFLEKNRD